MTLQPLQDAGKIRNWAKVERYGYQEAQGGTLNGKVTICFGYLVVPIKGDVFEVYAPTEKEAHNNAVEFINGL